MADTIEEKGVRDDWPVVSGLGADDKHEGRKQVLLPEEGSNLFERNKVGID